MSLSLTASFVAKSNSVLPLAQSGTVAGLAVRVASAGSDILGTLTATGAASGTLNWSIAQNPTWVTIAPDSTGTLLTISFSNAQAQANPYQFYISCTDGVATANFPILLEVKDPLSLAAAGGGTTFSIASYDSTVPDTVLQGIGLNGVVESGVSFIPPLVLPSGMEFVTSDGSEMILRVAESTSSNLSGGLALFVDSPATTQVTLRAYKPGSMYDNPSRCFTQEFAVESLTAKTGTVDIALAAAWNATNSAYTLNAYVDFLEGKAPAVTYEWDIAGTAQGSITSGGTSADTTLVWTATLDGLVQFTFKVKNAATGVLLGEQILAPTVNGVAPGIPVSAAATWTSSAAVKIEISNPVERGFVGDSPSVTLSTPVAELAANEQITVTLALSTASTLETGITLATTTVTLNATTPSATVPVTIPASGLNQKWRLSAVAANAATGATRTGYAEAVFESNGSPEMVVAATGGPSLTSSTGSSLVGVTLTATTTASAPISGATFSLLGAPDGLFITGNTLSGNALEPGVYTFQIIAEAAGFARSFSPTLTLTVSQVAVPLTITQATPSVASLPDGTQYNVAWGIAGTPTTLNLIQNFTVRNVLGMTQASTSQVGSSVLTVYGESFYGDAYSIPAMVLSSSITALGNLLNAPTVGTIDENFNLTLNWQPLSVNGSYQVYKGFNIWLSAPNATPVLQTVNGQIPTGLEDTNATVDSRLFEETLSAGDWVVDMQALSNNFSVAQNASEWDQPHQFPTALTAASVNFDNQTISIGESLTITLNPNYTGATSWCAFFPDGTNTGWLPLSIRSAAKAFTTAGSMPIVIQTRNDFSKANPGVKLQRQVTLTVYVMNQQFNPSTSDSGLTGDLGLGGSDGFEVVGVGSGGTASSYQITDASNGAVALNPYEVVVRALVRDTLSNELKLMVATARTADASSLLGTMAIDVFPLLGRPRIKDLINPALFLTPEQVLPGNPVKISTTALPNAIVGQPMNDFPMQVTANSGVGPFSWYADSLPPGLKLSINGTLSGTPTTLGTTTMDFVVMDSNFPPFIAETSLALTVETNLAITTLTLPAAVVGTPYNIPVTATGGLPPLTWSIVSGSAPTGITLDPNTGILVGVPVTYNSTTDYGTTYAFTVQAMDAIGAVASQALTCTLSPGALSFGPLDQPQIFANDSFCLRVPVFGGRAPYQLANFSDDGVIGTGLAIINPDAVAAVAGITPPVLAITTTAQNFFPEAYPANLSIPLTATGGVAPYQFSVVAGINTTVPDAAIFGNLLTANATANGFYNAQVQVTDHQGSIATATIPMEVQQQNAGVGGGFSIKAVTAALNGSNNPANWTVTPIAALPDATNGQPYTAAPGTYYGLALYNNGVLQMTQATGVSSAPMNFSILSGALPGGMVAFSGNSFGQTTDFSGIQLFNVSGGQNATVNGSFSFVAEFSNINVANFNNPIFPGAGATVISRESITVTTAGGGTTPVVVITSGLQVDLAAIGSVDPHYTLVTSADPTSVGPNTYIVGTGTADSQTIAPSATQGTFANGLYVYQTTFDLTGLDPATAVLTGNMSADDFVVMLLNGVQVATSSPFTVNSGFIAGINTLHFNVTNNDGNPAYNNGGGPANITSLQVQISGTANSITGGTVEEIPVFGTGALQDGGSGNFAVDLTTATATPYPWMYPLTAEGGTGPYNFHILSGTTLPGAVVATLNGLPALASSTGTADIYEVFLSASDTNGVTAPAVSIAVNLTQTPTEPVHIIGSNLPTSLYLGRPLPVNTYFIETDLLANFTVSGLPPGITLSSAPGTVGYLSGTPTAIGNYTLTFTATSVVYNTTATQTAQINIGAQTATFLNPPSSAVIGTDYRVANNNAIIFVQYTGYQPTDANLPLPTSQTAPNGLGAPGKLAGGVPTTGVQSLTSTSFVMGFDYENTTPGNDTLTIGSNTAVVAVTYPTLTAVAKTVSATVSEYSVTASFTAPVTISGGLAPYTVTYAGFSDPRFTASGTNVVLSVAQFTTGSTVSCQVSMLVTDSSGQSATAVGTITLVVQQAAFIAVNFTNSSLAVNVSSGTPFTTFVLPNLLQSVPQLGHAPFQFYVDSVTLPVNLSPFVQVSPTKRVLAIQFNNTNTSASIADVNASLAPSGSFVVPAVAPAAAPSPGSYAIPLTLRVVDSEGYGASQTVTLTLVIS